MILAALGIGVGAILANSKLQGRKSLSDYGFTQDGITRVEIVYFPERISTRSSLTPEMLERLYEYKVEVRDVSESKQFPALVAALRGTLAVPENRLSDVRTGVIFFDKSNKRLLTLYFDQFGKNGFVNGEPVSMNNDVYRWAKAMMRGFAD